MASTDDSGVSSASRGHTPNGSTGSRHVRAASTAGRFVKTDYEGKKKAHPASFANEEKAKRKNTSPVKERPPRGHGKQLRMAVQQPLSTSSPKKKTINANSATAAPSFMKLSKVGQKIPERRGGSRVSNPTLSSSNSSSPANDEKENKSKKPTEQPTAKSELIPESLPDKVKMKEQAPVKCAEQPKIQTILPSSHCIFHPTDVSKIILGPDGDMNNIPPTMLSDQYGMAAMLPILDIVKNRAINANTDLTEEKLRDKIKNENIEMMTIGFDLNELGVPMTTQDTNQKSVWETFAGPFASEPLLPANMGLTYNQVPNVYYTARTLQSSFDMLHNIPDKFGVHELFYIFYNLPKELWQLNAARELQYRGWRYNMKEKLWVHKKLGEPDDFGITITAPQNIFTVPASNQEDVMIGIFEIYDAEKARICSAELCLRRSDFEVPAWEQKVPDAYQKMVSAMIPKEMLWGPREDRKQYGLMQGITGLLAPGHGRNKVSNLVIPKQQPSERRLLSFAESPDITPTFDNPFGTNPTGNTAEDLYRQQMYAMIVQKMQMHQQQQFQQHQQLQSGGSASNLSKQATSSSFSSSNLF